MKFGLKKWLSPNHTTIDLDLFYYCLMTLHPLEYVLILSLTWALTAMDKTYVGWNA